MSDRSMAPGKVWLVGAGPGAPDLLTLRAARLIERAEVLFHDALVHPETVALANRAEKIAVGKRCGRHSTAQAFINKRLIDAARRHGTVVRLKGGDPMLFGRAQEEIDALVAAGIEVEVVPGITAALAASASLGVSLTRRALSRNVVFVTPRIGAGLTTPRQGAGEAAGDWIASVATADTAAIYMGAGEAGAIAAALIDRGVSPDTPVAVIESASLPQERQHFGRLAGLAELASRVDAGPALILLGRVLREQTACAEAATAAIAPATRRAAA